MEPLIALVGVTGLVFGVNRIWLHRARGVEIALRAGVGAMFTLTGIAHFVGMRAELVAMISGWLPAPDLIVTATGILELAGAAAMLHRRLATLAAAGLTLMLTAIFPANVAHALSGAPIAWSAELLPRTVMQLIFLAATVSVFALTRRPTHRDGQRWVPVSGSDGGTGDGLVLGREVRNRG